MPKFAKIIIGVVAGIVVLGGIVIAAVMFLLGNESKVKEIKFGNDRIPTVYMIVGDRKVSGIEKSSGTVSKKVMTYRNGEISSNDIIEYVNGLKEDGFIITETFENNSGQLGKESVDDGDIILINIEFNNLGNTVITYLKGEGTITRY